HGKNYSLLYQRDGIALAPLYDLLSTVTYDELSPKLAMKIGAHATLEELRADDWQRFAEDCGITRPLVRRRIRELGRGALEHASGVATSLGGIGLDDAALERYAESVRRRAAALESTAP